jgi:glycyl-tRNA synthetase beta chain
MLIEIGVEEIPAGVSQSLLHALRDELNKLLAAHGIADAAWTEGCTPRRLLLYWPACPEKQADHDETIWGPPEQVAYKDGQPTKAAEGFAKKSGLSVSDFALEDKGDGKARYLKAVVHRKGRTVVDIVAEAMPGILRKLPSPKQMKWNEGETRDDAFIRPVRWIVARLGDQVIPFSFAGVESGKLSRGHRIHGGQGELDVGDPLGWLRTQKIEADRAARVEKIGNDMARIAKNNGLSVVTDEDLIDEVADLTEWPVPILCEFDADFLRLPEEVVRITLKSHQRCFITRNADGSPSNEFFAVANIESKQPEQVAQGNARVVNARLSDAAFYFDRDPKQSLDERVERLNEIVFQDGLGTVGDHVARLRGFVLDTADAIGADANAAQRAAYLCKSDLTTGLVYEFPELQGYMGGIYARMQGEPEKVATAIAEHYQPAGAEDALPSTPEARLIAIAERADKLLGYFHLGKIPTASADPYGLRRAAIGLIRLLADAGMPARLTLTRSIDQAARQWNEQRATIAISGDTKQAVANFIEERLLHMADPLEVSRSTLDAVLAADVERPLYRQIEIAKLLLGFAESETGQAVAAANKRIANILKKTEVTTTKIDAGLFAEEAEKELFAALEKAEAGFPDDAEGQLTVLAALRGPVDRFFDDVMVMCDDAAVRNNRLALLARLRGLFLKLADISRL